MSIYNEKPIGFDTKSEVREIVKNYAIYWYVFILSVALCLFGAFGYIRFFTSPIYEVGSSLLVKSDRAKPGKTKESGLGELEIGNNSQSVENKIEELKSVTLVERVIQELGLTTSYYQKASFRNVELYGKEVPIKVIVKQLSRNATEQDISIKIEDEATFRLTDNSSESTYRFGQNIHKSYGTFVINKTVVLAEQTSTILKIRFHNLSILTQSYLKNLSVSSVSEDADVLSVKLLTAVPKQGVEILNKLIEVANKEDLEDKNEIAINTIKFIDERLKYLTSDLAGVEKNVEQLKQENNLTNVTSDAQMYLDKSGDFSNQVAEADIQLSVVQSIERYLSAGSNQLVPSTLGIQDATLTTHVNEYNKLLLDKQRLLRNNNANNPLVLDIDDRLAGVRQNLIENVNNIKRSLSISKRNYSSNTSQYQAKIRNVPTVERELQQIQRQQSVKQNLYLYLLQKREESALALAATVSNSRVIESVNVNPIPVSPKKPLIYLCALIIGLGFPVAGVYTKGLLNNKVQSISEIQSIANVNILGELSHNNDSKSLVVTPNSRTTISELFRLVRSNLNFLTSNSGNKVLLVTSSMSGEGKTFITTNLGSSIALTKKKVVLLEMDLRNPQLLKALNLKSIKKGISEYLGDEDINDINDIIIEVPESPNLYVISAGVIKENPAELLLNSRLPLLIDELRKQFDYILIDSSPVGQVADALSIAQYSDSTIYVVRYNYTLSTQLNIINDISTKVKDLMVVINDAKINNYKGYGYAYGYQNSKRVKMLN